MNDLTSLLSSLSGKASAEAPAEDTPSEATAAPTEATTEATTAPVPALDISEWEKAIQSYVSPVDFLNVVLSLSNYKGYSLQSVLGNVNRALVDNPELSDLMRPEHIGAISEAIQSVVTLTHTAASKKAKATRKTRAKKKEISEEKQGILDSLGDVFASATDNPL